MSAFLGQRPVSKIMKKTKPKKKQASSQRASAKPTRVVFLLDRTGSMDSVKKETISGFNGYLDTLKAAPNLSITLVQFDSVGIDKLCEGAALNDCPRLNSDNYQPRAMTPLYDALGRTLVSTRESVKGEKVLFVTLTDGEENASVEWNSAKVKDLMKELEDQNHWTFAYIGVGVQGWKAMEQVSSGLISAKNVMNITQDPKQVARAYRRAGGQTVAYACSIGADTTPMKDFWGGQNDKDSDK